MATFLTDIIKKGYTRDEVFAVIFESKQDRERRRILAIVTKAVDAHRLEKMKELLAYEKLATWRRMNDFDRVAEGEENLFRGHRSLPPTPEQYTASLRFELQKLKDAISMPNEEFPRPKRPVEKRGREDEELQKKKMAESRSDSLDELLANFEFARIKEYVEKRSREEAQAQVTVAPVGTVQHCSPCAPNPDMPSDVYFRLESIEGKMSPELEEFKSPSAGTGLETPGQPCPPNEGIWETGRTPASGILTAGVDSDQEGNFFQLRRKAWTRERVKQVRELRQTSPSCSRATNPEAKRTSSSTPVGKGKRHRLGTRL